MSQRRSRNKISSGNIRQCVAFILGCTITAMIKLNLTAERITSPIVTTSSPSLLHQSPSSGGSSILDGKRILVAIASYDFSQFPHLEEVLEGFHDLCIAGANVDIYIHTTIPYPVMLIDLLNTRHKCSNISPRSGLAIYIILVSPSVRLHLVDFHRTLFYEKVDQYDVFIYTEDDIRVTPHTIGAYLYETQAVSQIVGPDQASNFNVGIVRYEYNYPNNLVIDDNTRAATANVTRVYWEHSWHPAIPKSVDAVPQESLSKTYVHMTNHHQGMYIATRDLLKAWKVRPGCNFDVVRERPGQKNKPSQPSEGTQRVWMSSQMLYGSKHCNVQQVIPMDRFGQLSVLHLPNKNYRRVGRKGRIGGGKKGHTDTPDLGNVTVESPSTLLLSAMNLHLQFAKRWPRQPEIPYKGPVYMFNKGFDHPAAKVKQMMNEYDAYVARGGILSVQDMKDSL
jgi:hypothetical protein